MASLAFVIHHDRGSAVALAKDATAWLLERGHSVRFLPDDAARAGHAERGCELSQFTEGVDVAVSLGGDGTMLRTVDLVGDAQVPVIGVNLGQLGYLTEVEPAHLHDALEQFLSGSYCIEERMRLSVVIETQGEGPEPNRVSLPALNEAVLEKTPAGHTVRIAVIVDGEQFTTYTTDGLIVATPTGSTAYAFSARGPIVSPHHRALLLTPVSPHMLFDRTLVLDPASSIRLQVLADRPAAVAVDGRNAGMLGEGDAVVCTEAEHAARLVTFAPRNFLGILKRKFGLNDR